MQDAEKYLQQFITHDPGKKFSGNFGLERTRYLLSLLKNPQNKLKIIHIAGTSGKGSTAIYTSTILESLDFRVGLHVSPFFIDFRERFQINNSFITEKVFCKYLTDIIPAIEKTKKSRFGSPSYFEILISLVFYIFWREKVDYAVIETGLGGLLDPTNTIKNKNKLCVLTKIGHDHTKILGNTLDKIATQKAGIIQEGNVALAVWQDKAIRKIFEKKTLQAKGKLEYIKKGINFKNVRLKNHKIIFDFYFEKYVLKNIQLGTPAHFQVENCALAILTVLKLSQRDNFSLKEQKIRIALREKTLVGRMEILSINKKTLILDGAHNPQKIKFFIESLQKAYPKKKFSFLIAFKQGEKYNKMLDFIIPNAKNIIISTPEASIILTKYFEKKNFLNYKAIPDPKKALRELLKKSSGVRVITGSIYLLSKIYPLINRRRSRD